MARRRVTHRPARRPTRRPTRRPVRRPGGLWLRLRRLVMAWLRLLTTPSPGRPPAGRPEASRPQPHGTRPWTAGPDVLDELEQLDEDQEAADDAPVHITASDSTSSATATPTDRR